MFAMHNPIRFIDPRGLYTYDLGRGWFARIERDKSGSTQRKHVHLFNDSEHWSQNDDGSPHDKGGNSPGSPPRRVLRDLKNKTGWDWVGNQNKWLSQIMINHDIFETHGITTITFPDGRVAQRAFALGRGFGVSGPISFSNDALIRMFLETGAPFIGPMPFCPATHFPIMPIWPNPTLPSLPPLTIPKLTPKLVWV